MCAQEVLRNTSFQDVEFWKLNACIPGTRLSDCPVCLWDEGSMLLLLSCRNVNVINSSSKYARVQAIRECIWWGKVWAHFLDQTARKPKVRLETMAEMKPVQLKVRSEADASATPICAHMRTCQKIR